MCSVLMAKCSAISMDANVLRNDQMLKCSAISKYANVLCMDHQVLCYQYGFQSALCG